jgi:hypothetical protein
MGPGDETRFTTRRTGEDTGDDAAGGGEDERRGDITALPECVRLACGVMGIVDEGACMAL